MNIALLIAVVAVIVAALIYFAQRQGTTRDRQQDAANAAREARKEKIAQSVRAYVDSALQIGGIPGALRAGVTELPDGNAVAEFLDRCASAGETCLASTYRSELQNSELLVFFQRCAERQDALSNDATIRTIIANIQGERHA